MNTALNLISPPTRTKRQRRNRRLRQAKRLRMCKTRRRLATRRGKFSRQARRCFAWFRRHTLLASLWRPRRYRRCWFSRLFGAATLAMIASASAGTVTVDTDTDVTDGDTSSITTLQASPGSDGVISLREAIEAANNTAGADTITFAPGVTGILRLT